MTGPLQGFSFLELGDTPSVAYAGALLVQLGATVVRVGGDAVPRHDPCGWLAAGKLYTPGVADPAALAGSAVSGALEVVAGGGPGLGRVAGFPVVPAAPDPAPQEDWAASGGMALTGLAGEAPRDVPGWHTAFLRGAVLALRLLARLGGASVRAIEDLDGPAVVGERAAIAGLGRGGRTSVGGACRLLETSDGWVAVNLARRADLEAVEAWLGRDALAPPGGDPWEPLSRALRRVGARWAVERGQLLGVPVGDVRGARDESITRPCFAVEGAGEARMSPRAAAVGGPALVPAARVAPKRLRGSRVLDLSAMWAGPLATSLLAAAGAEVVKVEDVGRPDGARRGPEALFDLLNGGKLSVSVRLGSPEGRHVLRCLAARADLVVDSSRPRVSNALGLDGGAGREVPRLSLTGYRRGGERQDWVAFGDDAAASAGAAALAGGDRGDPVFMSDAYADPAAGLHAAVAALAMLVGDGSWGIGVALHDVVAQLLTGARRSGGSDPSPRPCRAGGSGRTNPVVVAAAPRARLPWARAPRLGEHDRDLLGPPRVGLGVGP